MLLKIAGLALLFGFSVYAGQYAAYIYNSRLKQTAAFRTLITHIKSQIEYFNSTLSEIYSSFNNETLIACGFLDRLKKGEEFTKALETKGLRIKADVLIVLNEFGAALGKSGRDEQLANCDWALSRLDKIYTLQLSELPKSAKLAKSFGFMTGVMLVILFI